MILLPALLIALSRSVGSIEFASHAFPNVSRFAQVLYMFGSVFLLFGAVPFVVIRFVFHDSLREYGVRFGDWKTGLLATAVLFPAIAVLLLLPASQTPEMRTFYPFDTAAAASFWHLARLETARGLLFYTAWEFLFRGFMLFGLRRYVGDWLAISIQTLPSCLWHIGMPTGELIASIAGGVLFGVIALRTNSIVWPLLLHLLIGSALDAMIVHTL